MNNSYFWTSSDQTVTVKLSEVVAFYLSDDDDWVIEYCVGGQPQTIWIPTEDAPLFRFALHNLHTVKEFS